MTSRSFTTRASMLVAFLFLALCAAAALLVSRQYTYELVLVPIVIYLLRSLYLMQVRLRDEANVFTESIRYHDFSRHYKTTGGTGELRSLWKNFNDINAVFKEISLEKERQYQYLQRILELIDTGILSYDIETGEIHWMNEALKKLTGIPYLRTINGFAERSNEILHELKHITSGSSRVVTITAGQVTRRILMSASTFASGGTQYMLVAFQNVNNALDQAETLAWQRLLNVLTHEIMNSIAPISSLADTLQQRVSSLPNDGRGIAEDVALGMETIRNRSSGLLKFAEIYRSLNKITSLQMERVYIRDIFEKVYTLMHPTLAARNIDLEVHLKDPSLTIQADPNLLEQVLINLVLNAIDATEKQPAPVITFSAFTADDKVCIKIADNGIGMDESLLEQIFVPFFTTRKKGSGVGLSLCRQVMVLHQGNIQASSIPGRGSIFTLQFPIV